MIKSISDNELKDTVLEICRENPRERNPQIDLSCVYDNRDGRGCLIGTLLKELGLPLPRTNSLGFDVVCAEWEDEMGIKENPFSQYQAHFLSRVQGLADQTDPDGLPEQWGNLIGVIVGMEVE